MDHMLLPKDPSSPSVKVPYVCTQSYDGGPFLEYPIRMLKPWILPNPSSKRYMPYRTWEALHPTPTRELEDFLQTWLFFGLIQGFQGETFKEEDYIDDSNPSVRYVSTAKMLSNLDKTRQIRVIDASIDRRKLFETISKWLRLAVDVTQACPKDFDWRIKLSIVSVCELLAHSLWTTFISLGMKGDHTGGFSYNFYNNVIDTEMQQNGWCPCDIGRVFEKFRHFQTLYFVTKLKRIETGQDHTQCTVEYCSSYRTDRESYQTLHREDNCKCLSLSVKTETIVEILRRGNLPLLKLVRSEECPDECHIQVVESTMATPYVPISHVWKDGMGNPNGNALPQCQLKHVAKLVDGLKSELFPKPGNEPLLFWIDTICCPVEPWDAKLLAISMLRKTYGDATAILVIDADLQLCDHSQIHGVEVLARFYTCGWMHRLWTLQEGGLAKRVFVQFKHKAIELEKQYKEVVGGLGSSVKFIGPYMDFNAQQSAVTKFLDSGQNLYGNWDKVGSHLRRLDKALKTRSVSVEGDEPLCIATLLNLDINFENHPQKLSPRMCQIWKSLAQKYTGLPKQIVFLENPKLDIPGFRWAPKTLLHSSRRDRFHSTTRLEFWNDSELGQVDPRGFLVSGPGFKLNTTAFKGLNQVTSLRIPEEWRIVLTTTDRKLYIIGRMEINAPEAIKNGKQVMHDLVCKGSCALYLHNSLGKAETPIQALLVDIVEDKEGILYSNICLHVIFTKAVPGEEIATIHAERLAQILHEDSSSAVVVRMINSNQQGSAEYLAAVKVLEARAKELAAEALREVPGLHDAVSDSFGGEEALGGYWILITEFYKYGTFCGTELPEQQKWCLD